MESILKLFETQTQFNIMLQIGVDVIMLGHSCGDPGREKAPDLEKR